MTEHHIRTAVVDGFNNAPLDTGVPVELQFAIDPGALCADGGLDLKGRARLHD